MNKVIMILFFVAIFALVSAYPSTYGYGSYKGDYGDYYKKDYGYGFEPYYPPHFGSGYDKYIYGPYEQHSGPYDYHGKTYGDHYGYEHKSHGGYKQSPYTYGYKYSKYY